MFKKLCLSAALLLLLTGCAKALPDEPSTFAQAQIESTLQAVAATITLEQTEAETYNEVQTSLREETTAASTATTKKCVPATTASFKSTAASTGAAATSITSATTATHTSAAPTTLTATAVSPVMPSAATSAAPAATIEVVAYCDCKTAESYGIREQSGYDRLIPESGILFNTSLTLKAGSTAMDAFKAAAQKQGVVFSEQHGYIKGVAGLSEKACGSTSGWLYSVNGSFPQASADKYVLKNNDTVRLLYSVKSGDIAQLDWS